ncbi:hypothetical protein D0869_08690 [Hortaea werneckii]|uniref:Uncharacterized protein n=1 Tax=Hortaea werneckii TaxID=91943 RepID=A0A3M6WKF2_HORWE|nr:hypothetical protein D0869_08690 [Hortaea werneckii]
MSVDSQLTLFDLVRRDGKRSWSGNVWKARLFLNYKGIPYQTHWVDYLTLKPTLSSLGCPPNEQGRYTVPTVRLSDGSWIMDSLVIARKLKEMYPEPKLIFDEASLADVQKGLGMTAPPLFPVIMPRIATIVTQDSEAYFREMRAKDYGMPLEEFARTKGGEKAWADAEPGFRFLAELYGKDNNGPFLMGSQPSFGDFVIVAFIECVMRVGEDMGQRWLSMDERLARVHEACKPWMEKDF